MIIISNKYQVSTWQSSRAVNNSTTMDINSFLGKDLIGYCFGNEETAVENDNIDHFILAALEQLDLLPS